MHVAKETQLAFSCQVFEELHLAGQIACTGLTAKA
jgi:hypothetical protein